MDPDVFWRLDRNGRVKSRVCTTTLGLFLLLATVFTVDPAPLDSQPRITNSYWPLLISTQLR